MRPFLESIRAFPVQFSREGRDMTEEIQTLAQDKPRTNVDRITALEERLHVLEEQMIDIENNLNYLVNSWQVRSERIELVFQAADSLERFSQELSLADVAKIKSLIHKLMP